MASVCSARPGARSLAGEAAGIGEPARERQRGREIRMPRPEGAGGQSRGHSGLLGDDWKIRLAQKAFDQPRQDTGCLCPPRLLTGSCISAAQEPRARGRDESSPAPGAGNGGSQDHSMPTSLSIPHRSGTSWGPLVPSPLLLWNISHTASLV